MSEPIEHSPEYRKVLGSLRWRNLRKERLRQTMHRCERCGKTSGDSSNLQLHHKTYDRLGAELPADIELLCKQCHARADAERVEEVAERAADRLFDARVSGWAVKRYGDDWWMRYDFSEVAEEFETWLEKRGEAEW